VRLQFQLENPSVITLEIYTLQGQLVSSSFEGDLGRGVHDILVTGDQMQPGIYFCILDSEEGSFLAKLIKMK
jgi:hypothetical protein